MTPQKVFLYLSIVLLTLGLLMFVFPKEGIDLFGLKIKMPTFEEVFFQQKTEYADVEKIVQKVSNQTPVSESKSTEEDDIVSFVYLDEMEQSLIELSLDFEQMEQGNGSVRILHYGDSQIEADRISGTLRNDLQKEYGGCGQGVIPMYSRSTIGGVSYIYSSNWNFCSVLNPQKGLNRYGPCLSSIKAIEDSTGANAWVEISFTKRPKCGLNLYYASPDKTSRMVVSSAGNQIADIAIETTTVLQQISIEPNMLGNKLRIECESGVELYCMDISENKGVLVDNVSLRGSSGWGIRGSNSTMLSTFLQDMDIDMIIMQFGVNAIPQKEDEVVEDYGFYKKEFAKQLQYLHRVAPDALVVVIGVSDRSIRSGSSYVTNPNVLKLRQVQKEAALENTCVFWDLFEAMGGNNSMPAWVLREEPLANKDFIHFNNKGAEFVGKMFLKSLFKELEKRKAANNTVKILSN